MLKLLRHLLCVGILLGLAGNGVAVAAPCILMTQSQPATMANMPDCEMGANCTDCGAKDAGSHKSGKDKAPGCMAMAASAAVLAVKEPVSAEVEHRTSGTAFWPAAAILAGRNDAPEPEPPTFLG